MPQAKMTTGKMVKSKASAKKTVKPASKPIKEYGGKEVYPSKPAMAKHEGKEGKKMEAKEKFLEMIKAKKKKK